MAGFPPTPNPDATNPNDGFDWTMAEADIVNLDAARYRRSKPNLDKSQDRHFDVELDDEPAPGGIPVDVPEVAPNGHRPIVPSHLQNWPNIKSTVRYWTGEAGYRVGFHAVRSPIYAALAGFWSTVGLFRTVNRLRRWWWCSEQHGLRQGAADTGDSQMWFKLHREVKATRAWRGGVLAIGAATAMIGGPMLYAWAPRWAIALVLVAAVVGLARLGRPADRPIITPAVVAGRFRRINADIVLRAYYAAGLGHPEKPNMQVMFGSTMARDANGSGSQVVIDLPHGKTVDDAIRACLEVSLVSELP